MAFAFTSVCFVVVLLRLNQCGKLHEEQLVEVLSSGNTNYIIESYKTGSFTDSKFRESVVFRKKVLATHIHCFWWGLSVPLGDATPESSPRLERHYLMCIRAPYLSYLIDNIFRSIYFFGLPWRFFLEDMQEQETTRCITVYRRMGGLLCHEV